MELIVMATAAPPKSRSTSAKRAANTSGEPRDGDGRFTKESPRSTSARKKPARTELGAGAMLAAGAAGLAVGLAANIARKFAVQAPTLLAGEWDEALKAEHGLTLKVFDAIEATTVSDTTKRATLLMTLKHMLAKHALEEENVIYPALREVGEIDAADALNNDHGYVKQYLYELGEMPKDSPFWIDKVRTFRADIERHMREEESDLFPRLRSRVSAEKNKELTALMNKEGLKLA
jgi:hemerythrin superfamily protein